MNELSTRVPGNPSDNWMQQQEPGRELVQDWSWKAGLTAARQDFQAGTPKYYSWLDSKMSLPRCHTRTQCMLEYLWARSWAKIDNTTKYCTFYALSIEGVTEGTRETRETRGPGKPTEERVVLAERARPTYWHDTKMLLYDFWLMHTKSDCWIHNNLANSRFTIIKVFSSSRDEHVRLLLLSSNVSPSPKSRFQFAAHSQKSPRFSVFIIIIFAPDRQWQQPVETEKILKFKFVF